MDALDKLREQSRAIAGDYEAAKSGLDAARRELEALYSRSEALAERMRQKDVEAEQQRARLSEAEARVSEAEAEAAVLRNSIENSRQSAERMRGELSEQTERAAGIAAQIDEHKTRIAEIDEQTKKLEADAASARNVMDGRRMRIENREREAAEANDALTKQIVELRSADSRIAMLGEMEKEYEASPARSRPSCESRRRGTPARRGTAPDGGSCCAQDERCTLAIETALGAAIQNIVVDTQDDGRRAIEFLKRRDAGRATFLPIDTIRGGRARPHPL